MESNNLLISGVVNFRKYEVSKPYELFEYVGLATVAILVPLLFKHPQLLVGTIVNFTLIMAAINTKGWKKIISLIILPSVSAVMGGYLFGQFSMFLVYFMPFIWIGNSILVFVFKYFYSVKKENYLNTLISASVFKSGFLFLCALVLVKFSVVPSIFLAAMGLVQFYTAVIGGLMALPVNYVYNKSFEKN